MTNYNHIKPQPASIPNENNPVYISVLTDHIERSKIGYKKYGCFLQPHNGRSGLVDAYQEALDLTVYLKQCLMELDMDSSEPTELW